MRYIPTLLIILIVILMISPSVVDAKKECTWKQVTNLQFETPENLAIYQIDLKDIPITGNNEQTIILNAYGQIYKLNVKVIGGPWFDIYINLTYPNGTTVAREHHIFNWNPLGWNYDLRIQYYYVDPNMNQLNLQIYVFLEPFDSAVTEMPLLKPVAFNHTYKGSLVFESVSISSNTKIGTVRIICITPDEYKHIRTNPSPLTDFLKEVGKKVGSWTWQQILNTVKKIPVAGEYLSSGLEFMATLVGETFFYAKLFLIDNWEITVLTFESFAMMYSLSRSRDIFSMFGKYIDFHIKTAELIYKLIVGAIQLIFKLIQAVGSLIPF